jgi:outer membrane lipoprotein SlyB
MSLTENKDYTVADHRSSTINASLDGNSQNDPGKGVVLGTIGGTIVGGLAGGPIGALVGAVAGATASGVAVAVVDNADHDDSPREPGREAVEDPTGENLHHERFVGNVVERDGVSHPVIFDDTQD